MALGGKGLLFLASRRSRWRRPASQLARLVFLTLAAAGLFSLGRYHRDPVTYGRTRGHRSLAAHVATSLETGDLLVPHFPDPSLSYYFRDVPMPQQMQPARRDLSSQEIEAAIAQLATRYQRLWFVPAHRSFWDPKDLVFRWLDYHMILEEEFTFGDLTLQAYRSPEAAAPILTPVEATFGEQLYLKSAYVTVDGQAQTLDDGELVLAAGTMVNVNLIWRANAQVPDSYTVFVHLLDEQGRLIAQHDGIPAHGTRPTMTWQPGELLLDEHELMLPSELAGKRGMLTVGMYDSNTLARQPVAGGRETVTLARVGFSPPR